MGYEPVVKSAAERSAANLSDYRWACHDFTWRHARTWLPQQPSGAGLNIAYQAVDRHARGERADAVALRCLNQAGAGHDLTYAQLAEQTSRFANVLGGLGVKPGERVFCLLDRCPQLYVAALGTLKYTAVLAPLFCAFGREPVRQRLAFGDAAVVVTTPELYEERVAPVLPMLPALRHVLVTGEDVPAGTTSLERAMSGAGAGFEVPPTDPLSMALIHFTSGATGRPKGVVHVHEAVVAHHATGRLALDLRPDDVFWCTADPGWVTGTSYGIVAPLTVGATVLVDEREYEAERWYANLARHRVTVWYTAPSELWMLMRHGGDLATRHDLSALRHVASTGEPLNPEIVGWGLRALGRAVHDAWGQTETGAIMISNFAGLDIRPGSMGLPVPGVEAALLRRGEDGRAAVRDGRVSPIEEPGAVGELALRAGWPSMFRGYLHDTAGYARCFAGGWYLSGDLARRDDDGYYWFVGRADDVIKSGGHLVGPFEVESQLMRHPAVAEAGVIGKPDPGAGSLVKAFVALRPGHRPSTDLRRELLAFARGRLGALAPQQIDFAPDLPHTSNGKVLRRLLKARELGLPEDDVSRPEAA
ncbi:acetate--CoA ligase [Dactylosporangium sp. CA-233914]|uniref:acetate--CoA ligase n=1 Tax=Dactylosporangium sp. CA-233914 TaxID=3239934 RepID=UPI003D8B63E3